MAELISLIISIVNIFLLFFAIGYIGSGMATRFFEKRKARIVESIDSARTEKQNATQLHQEYSGRLENFQAERQSILTKAREKAAVRDAEIMADANKEAQRIVDRANREAELKKAKVKDDVKRDMVNIAAAVAAKLIKENINEEKQTLLIEETLKEMGEQTWQN